MKYSLEMEPMIKNNEKKMDVTSERADVDK